jgi:hypothetical protein
MWLEGFWENPRYVGYEGAAGAAVPDSEITTDVFTLFEPLILQVADYWAGCSRLVSTSLLVAMVSTEPIMSNY